MPEITTLLPWIPALPLLAAMVTALAGAWMLRERSHLPAVIAIGLSFLLSVVLLLQVRSEASRTAKIGYEATRTLWSWANVPEAYEYRGTPRPLMAAEPRDFRVDVTLRADPLTAVMLVVVTFVSWLVAIYSMGYMHHDPGYWRFFTYISLFVFSMTMLVSVSNFVMLYVFWEAVGVCSYLLIGFWFQRPEAAAAGKKAFLVNRVGDFGFALAVFLIWTTYGTLNFHDTSEADGTVVAGVLGQARLADPDGFVGGTTGLAIGLLLLLGACGKSAQFPLHVWLPDAMEGPTPVSALIHAATMVTAGVYLVARSTPLFAAAPEAQEVVAMIGAFTAVFAGVIAVTQYDLKRVLAYSTISQLGYMFLGLGTGTLAGVVAGMFHLYTHAFFKALLFLGAGSVMHAMGGVIDMRQFGGLRRRLPVTHVTFLVGCLALAGVFPLAGFWSKDAILGAVYDRAQSGDALMASLLWCALGTALLTAFYTFRAFFLTFYGEERIPHEAGHHAHESPASMTRPLVILSLLSAIAWVAWEWWLGDFLSHTPGMAMELANGVSLAAAAHGNHGFVIAASTVAALTGLGLAAFLYLGRRTEIEWLAGLVEGTRRLHVGLVGRILADVVTWPLWIVYRLSFGKFFFDGIYQVFIVWPLCMSAWTFYWLDRELVDRAVNIIARVPSVIGSILRPLQNGMVQFYALAMVLGLLVLIGVPELRAHLAHLIQSSGN